MAEALIASPVISEAEIGRFVDLGLGRGVDATDPSPWLNKSSFQVRKVTVDNVIGTEEGGSLQSYENEVHSVVAMHNNLKVSAYVSNAPVTLSLEGEFSASSSMTRKAVGKKVINRTVSFHADFSDLPQFGSNTSRDIKPEDTTQSAQVLSIASTRSFLEEQSKFTFEERLSQWIMERILHRSELVGSSVEFDKDNSPSDNLANYIYSSSKEDLKKIMQDCRDFVNHFNITHYVSSISLGASYYRLLTESEYFRKVNGRGGVELTQYVGGSTTASYSKKLQRKADETKQIGIITDGKVERGSHGEAVVEIKVQPIQSLIHNRFLHLTLRKSCLDYINEKEDFNSGPFIIKCGDSSVYWKVARYPSGYKVEAVDDVHRASLFYVIPSDGRRAYEFFLGWQGDNVRESIRANTLATLPSVSKKLMRYLDTDVNKLGKNKGPLKLRSDLESEKARLTLHRRLISSRRDSPVDTLNWINENESFFLRCSRRRFAMDGYIAIYKKRNSKFKTRCVSSTHSHNEKNCWMLFQLLPSSVQDVEAMKKRRKPTRKIDKELDSYLHKFTQMLGFGSSSDEEEEEILSYPEDDLSGEEDTGNGCSKHARTVKAKKMVKKTVKTMNGGPERKKDSTAEIIGVNKELNELMEGQGTDVIVDIQFGASNETATSGLEKERRVGVASSAPVITTHGSARNATDSTEATGRTETNNHDSTAAAPRKIRFSEL